jgi:hypothetical protein
MFQDNNLGLRPGDVIVTWSSRLIGFMVNAVFGISDPATHAVMVYDDVQNISASTGGVKLRPIEDMFQARKWVVLRNKKLPSAEWIQWAADGYIGRGYDYFLYVLWIMRLSLVLQPLVWLICQPFRHWLKREEARRFGCSELIVQILKDLGIDTGIDDPSDAPPDNLLQTARSCVHDWEIVLSGGKFRRIK